jgi:hypothetical protein
VTDALPIVSDERARELAERCAVRLRTAQLTGAPANVMIPADELLAIIAQRDSYRRRARAAEAAQAAANRWLQGET